ncbi:7258_t:CDS:2, partial [Gigaspora rosea]
ENFAIIRSNNQGRKEIQYEVRQRHDINGIVFDDMANLIREITEADQIYLSKKKDTFEMLFFCATKYECRMKALVKYHAWSGDEEPNECAKCDNCNHRIKDNPIIRNVTPDIKELLRVVEVLTTTYDHQIIPADIIGVFRRSNAARMKKLGYQQLEEFYDQQNIKKSKKPKLLSTVELAEFALQDLLKRGLVLQDIILSRPHGTEYMSCTLVIEGLVDGAKEIVKAQEWKYW